MTLTFIVSFDRYGSPTASVKQCLWTHFPESSLAISFPGLISPLQEIHVVLNLAFILNEGLLFDKIPIIEKE